MKNTNWNFKQIWSHSFLNWKIVYVTLKYLRLLWFCPKEWKAKKYKLSMNNCESPNIHESFYIVLNIYKSNKIKNKIDFFTYVWVFVILICYHNMIKSMLTSTIPKMQCNVQISWAHNGLFVRLCKRPSLFPSYLNKINTSRQLPIVLYSALVLRLLNQTSMTDSKTLPSKF